MKPFFYFFYFFADASEAGTIRCFINTNVSNALPCVCSSKFVYIPFEVYHLTVYTLSMGLLKCDENFGYIIAFPVLHETNF